VYKRQVRAVVDELIKTKQAPNTDEQKIADFYTTYINTDAINAAGLKPFEADLKRISTLKTPADVATLMGDPAFSGTRSPVYAQPSLDAKNPDRYIIAIGQGGLGLPEREYYLKRDEAFSKIREQYRAYITQLLQMATFPDPEASAKAVYDLEVAIATQHWTLAKRRNRDLTYNPMSFDELKAFAAGFPWDAYLGTAGIAERPVYIIRERDAVQQLAKLFANTPVNTWRAYLTFHYIKAHSDIMPKAFDEATFAFMEGVLDGKEAQAPRWKRGLDALMGSYGHRPLAHAVGKLYVAKHFPPETKAQVQELVDNLLSAYRDRITTLEWMSPETRTPALKKAETVRVKIAYPQR